MLTPDESIHLKFDSIQANMSAIFILRFRYFSFFFYLFEDF